jgi:hypothetical protein
METNKIIKYSTASLYVVLYVIVATISCICSVDFFDMTHTNMSSIILAISFEIGSMGCLFGALTTLRNKDNALIWIMFVFLTLMQMMNNTYYSYVHIENYKDWIELFNLVDMEEITQKRIISIISGCVLPIVSLSFIHLLVDLLRADDTNNKPIDNTIADTDVYEEDDEYNDLSPKEPDENAVVYDAKPLTDDQKEEFKKFDKKSDIEIAKEEMQKAIDKLKTYNKNIGNEKG